MQFKILPPHKALAVMRQFVRPVGYLSKSAELGSNQVQFEQAFSSLGHSYLADKAPKLLQYELGFQLLEKNDDGTRAVGIFAFKVGDTVLYAPTFFLNGDLKGHELLYIKNQDMFVPLKDSWVNYILGRKPLSIGESVDRNLSNIGVQGPNLYQLSRAPHKWAADKNWRTAAIKEAAYFATTSPDVAFNGKPFSLDDFVKSAGLPTYKCLLTMCQLQPQLAQVLDKHHPGLLEDAAAHYSAKATEKKAGYKGTWCLGETPPEHLKRVKVEKKEMDGDDAIAAIPSRYRSGEPKKEKKKQSLLEVMEKGREKEAAAKPKKVKAVLVDKMSGMDFQKLPQEDRQTLVRKRYLVKDDRNPDEVAHAFDATTNFKLDNPTQTGIYSVLVRPSVLRKCLIIMKPYSSSGKHDFCTVVDLGNKKWVNISPTDVWVHAEEGMEDFNKWFEGLESPGEKSDGLAVLLTRNGQGTVPFRVSDFYGAPSSKDYSGVWDVHFRNWSNHGHSYTGKSIKYYGVYGDCLKERVRFTGKAGTAINRRENGELWFPEDVKIIVLKSPPKEEDAKNDCCYHDSSDPGPLDPGDLSDVLFEVHNNTYPLKVFSNGSDLTLRSKEQTGNMSKASAIVSLVLDHGLTEKAAVEIVDRAEKNPVKGCSLLIKSAAPSANMLGGPNAPSFPEPPVGYDPMTGGKYPTQESNEWGVPVQDVINTQGKREDYNPTIQPDHTALQQVMQSAQTGEKEVFDTTLLGGLLKSVRDDSVIDRYLPDLMKGMNALGRLLFSFYWHQDQFGDRYGKADLTEIEDGLRNAFEGIGEILLTLKARTVNSTLDEGMGSSDDLEDIANV